MMHGQTKIKCTKEFGVTNQQHQAFFYVPLWIKPLRKSKCLEAGESYRQRL